MVILSDIERHMRGLRYIQHTLERKARFYTESVPGCYVDTMSSDCEPTTVCICIGMLICYINRNLVGVVTSKQLIDSLLAIADKYNAYNNKIGFVKEEHSELTQALLDASCVDAF